MLRAMRTTIGALCAAALLAPAGAQTQLKVDDDVLDELEIESPFDLMGLYQGLSLDQKSVSAPRMELQLLRAIGQRAKVLEECSPRVARSL